MQRSAIAIAAAGKRNPVKRNVVMDVILVVSFMKSKWGPEAHYNGCPRKRIFNL